MKVGGLRRALEGVNDDREVVVSSYGTGADLPYCDKEKIIAVEGCDKPATVVYPVVLVVESL